MNETAPGATRSAILKTLCYFSIFKHPLTRDEIKQYCHDIQLDNTDHLTELDALVQQGFVNELNGYYFLTGESSFIERRICGEKIAPRFMQKARSYSRFISRFPYIRAVFISGSLSKGYMDEQSDIDYFIITEPGRLWLCRSLLILFKKIFLFNSHRYFCVNYFIDCDNLRIPDENIFTATELVFVLPMYNKKLYKDFRDQNSWTNSYYPNLNNVDREVPFDPGSHWLKSFLEKVFSGPTGEKLDTWFFKKTISYWKSKFTEFDETSFDLQLRSRKNVSKHHPRGFQQKVLSRFKEKLKQLPGSFEFENELSQNTHSVSSDLTNRYTR